MIWFLGDLLDNPPALFAFVAAFGVALVTGITFHEFSHAWAAYELGDSTAERQGRLSLNPARHLDPTGTVMMLLVGFGWGRPTPVNPYRLRTGPKAGNALVALAGPISNLVVASIAALPLRLGLVDSVATVDGIADASGTEIVGLFLIFIIFLNVLLAVFNLIPIHPLDGFKVAVGVLPGELSRQLQALAPYGPGILGVLILLSWIAPQYNVLGWFIGGVTDVIFNLLL
jgi:Zn-dependent protease